MTKRLPFTIHSTAQANTQARTTEFVTRQGTIVQTPMFMPVATVAAFRGIKTEDVATLNYPIILANTFHLFLRPTGPTLEKLGGIQKFMKWNGSVLTDSGGFQIFSMAENFQLSEKGARVRSFVDGTWHLFTPELSIQTQHQIGSDILMVLDQCVPSTSPRHIAHDAVQLSARWAKRSLDAHGDHTAAMFGIVQGACDLELRKLSAELTTALPFDGIAIGGLAVGEEKHEREDVTEFTTRLLPQDKPRYLMGVGTPIDILEAVHRGVDIFDCILPAAFGQQGEVFTSNGKLSLRRSVYKHDESPIDHRCSCPACQKYTRAYIHHLVKCKETIGQALCAVHNLTFYKNLCDTMKCEILAGTFHQYYLQAREQLVRTDELLPPTPPKVSRRPSKHLGDYELKQEGEAHYIAQKSSAEVMHPSKDPSIEANVLYVEGSSLIERAKSLGPNDTLVIWDVGLGAAFNAMAVIKALENFAPEYSCKVEMVSFEKDLDSLKLAMRHKPVFPHLWHQAPTSILTGDAWERGNISWRLIQGDFTEKLNKAATPDIVLFDPFSPKVDTPLWGYNSFIRLYDRMKDDSVLVTYSLSTAVRSALLGAGFFVGILPGVPPKEENTIAWKNPLPSRIEDKKLTARFLDRWHASDKKIPHDVKDIEEFSAKILSHRQWQQE